MSYTDLYRVKSSVIATASFTEREERRREGIRHDDDHGNRQRSRSRTPERRRRQQIRSLEERLPRSRRDEESNRQSTGNRNRDRSALRLDRRLEDRISVTDRLETKQTYQRRVRNVQRDRAFEDKPRGQVWRDRNSNRSKIDNSSHDPQTVPRARYYFEHDDRGDRRLKSMRGRSGLGRKTSPKQWKHDKYEEIVDKEHTSGSTSDPISHHDDGRDVVSDKEDTELLRRRQEQEGSPDDRASEDEDKSPRN
eukprot:gene2487-5417_t